MENITKSEYAVWLETLIKDIVEAKPDKIGVVFAKDDLTYTYYYGDCCPADKALMSYWIHADATMDTVMANAKLITDVAASESDENEEFDELEGV